MYIPVEFQETSVYGSRRITLNICKIVAVKDRGVDTAIYCDNDPTPIIISQNYDDVISCIMKATMTISKEISYE